jgi:predicted RNA-binding protein associated with RNAse of E/G family
MQADNHFSPGQTIILREVWDGKIWSAKPGIIVQDTPDMLAVYAPPGTMIKHPRTPECKRIKADNRLRSEWILIDNPWSEYHILRMTIPSAPYSVLAFWENPGMKFHDWYINLEDPLRRTASGFEYMDQWLDVIVAPDLVSWHWKDEDEFAEAVLLKLISQEKAKAMRLEGERVVKWLQSGKSPFHAWESWRPDPTWKVPVLPDGWDKV